MYRKLFSIVVLAIILLAVSAGDCAAYRKARKPKAPKPTKFIQAKFQLVPKLTGGFITGKPADYIDKTWDKVFYGVGLAGEYHLNSQNAFALNFEITWKDIPFKDYSYIRMFTIGAGWLYRFAPEVRTSVYFHPEIGFISGTLPDYPLDPLKGEDVKLGRHFYFRVALGLFRYTCTRVNNRAEIYYKAAFTKGHKMEQDESREIDFTTEGFGLELAVGIPL